MVKINSVKDIVSIPIALKKKEHQKSKKHDFLLSAKNLYLTYSNCNLELKRIIEILKEKLSSYILQEWVIVREYHETGEPHIHVYLKTLKKVIIKSASFLDLNGTFHGNYQSARKPNTVLEYMLKSIPIKTHPNLYYSDGISDLIGELANYKTLSESLLFIRLSRKWIHYPSYELFKKRRS